MRAAETELTLAQARVSEMNRAEAERVAAQRLADATDLWASGVAMADVLGEDGLIDPDRVDEAVSGLLGRKPHLGRRGPITPPASNVTGDGKPPGGNRGPTWVSAFGPSGG